MKRDSAKQASRTKVRAIPREIRRRLDALVRAASPAPLPVPIPVRNNEVWR